MNSSLLYHDFDHYILTSQRTWRCINFFQFAAMKFQRAEQICLMSATRLVTESRE